jgi:hypothetical protein
MLAARLLTQVVTPTQQWHRRVLSQYDGVLDGATQDAVYNATTQEAVDKVLSGYNATIFCYGQVTPQAAELWQAVSRWQARRGSRAASSRSKSRSRRTMPGQAATTRLLQRTKHSLL